jgi:hypothetical protein
MDKKELLKIQGFDSLLDFLVDELDWPLDIDNLGERELTFSYSAEEIGLPENLVAKVKSIKQLRPFTSGQPWAIFWMDFESKKLPITVLRRILRHFVVKKRAADPTKVTWQMEDIMFVSGHGDEETRGVTFAHFKNLDNNEVMREFSWDKRERSFENYISYLDNLKWSDKFETNPEEWSVAWRGAFTGSTREAVRTSKQLAISMAWIARDICDRVKEVYEIECKNDALHKLFESFKEGLIHDMTLDQFADMYAQTMTYGLFSARTMDTDGHFEIQEVADLIPSTNPFLKRLFKECLEVGKDHHQIDLDELGIGRLVELLDGLNKTDGTDVMTRILEEFGRRTGSGNEDPVIHFYEEFLKEYDQIQRVDKGVYYTPDPVVDFIVRSVNEQLKTEFGLEMGLADTTTWGEMIASERVDMPINSKTGQKFRQDSKDWNDIYKQLPFVQILDPATGTGTFLIRTITMIHYEVKAKHKRDHNQTPWQEYWNGYVNTKLFPRLYGFELMMASYSVAHMRISMHLKSLGYKFHKGQRLNVYLTNTLESPDEMGSPDLFISSIGAESQEAKQVKKYRLFSVIIGNPPYNVNGTNQGNWIMNLMKSFKMEPGGKEKLKERNPKVVNNDYIKFIRYGLYQIQKNNAGIIAYINPASYLINPTFRGVRWALLDRLDKIVNISLHGDSEEVNPNGEIDDNVFDIKQGVTINIFLLTKINSSTLSDTKFTELWGKRIDKYKFLMNNSINDILLNKVKHTSPYYLLIPINNPFEENYNRGFYLGSLFPKKSTGYKTSCDELVISPSRTELESRMTKILKHNFDNEKIIKTTYRPFDTSFLYYDDDILDRSRLKFTRNLLGEKMIIFVMGKSTSKNVMNHYFISKHITELKCGEYTKGSYMIPLFTHSRTGELGFHEIEPNINFKLAQSIASSINCKYVFEPDKCFDNGSNFIIFPLDIMDYIYSILYSDRFREKYKEFLKMDFPRIPFPKNQDTFWHLVKLGGELRQIHLLEFAMINYFISDYPVTGTNEVTKSMTPKSPGWIGSNEKSKTGDVWINDNQYFSNIPKVTWEFYIGGYQPAQKWLKDRKGRILTDEDIEHYQKIIVALTETDRIMKEIDKIDIE